MVVSNVKVKGGTERWWYPSFGSPEEGLGVDSSPSISRRLINIRSPTQST